MKVTLGFNSSYLWRSLLASREVMAKGCLWKSLLAGREVMAKGRL